MYINVQHVWDVIKFFFQRENKFMCYCPSVIPSISTLVEERLDSTGGDCYRWHETV